KDGYAAEFINNQVTFRVGAGANGTQGGTVNANSTVTIKFRATLTGNCDLLRCSGGSFNNSGAIDFYGNVNSGSHWSISSSPQPIAGQCDFPSAPVTVPIVVPATCTTSLPDKPFDIACETNVSTFNLPANYLLYEASDVAYTTPLSKVSTAGAYVARRLIATDCDDKFNVTIQVIPLSITLNTTQNVNCTGASTGALTLTIAELTGSTTQNWTRNGAPIPTPTNLNALPAGDYTVTVNNACQEATASATITEPAAALTATTSQTNVTCYGDNNGTLTITPSGGVGPYTYTFNGVNKEAVNSYTDLAPGKYTIVVTDANGCLYLWEPTITSNPLPLAFNLTGGGTYCAEGTGMPIGLSGSEIGVNYQLKLNGTDIGAPIAGTGAAITFGPQTAAGNYTVVAVNPTTTCSMPMTGTVAVSINPLPTPFNLTGNGAFCAGTAGAPIGLDGSQTGVNYQLQKDGANIGSVVVGTGSAISFGPQSAAGNYTVIALNAGTSCPKTMAGSIEVIPALEISASAVLVQDLTCPTKEGSIQVQSVSGGKAPYTYSIDGKDFVSSDTFTGLTNGTYSVTVMDAIGCTFSTNSITIQALNPPTDLKFISTPVTCLNVTSTITVSVVNGNAPFIYEIIAPSGFEKNNGNDNVFKDLKPGTYTFKVTDAKGCVIQNTFTINNMPKITILGDIVNDVTCKDSQTGSVKFYVNDFASKYSYSINGGAPVTGQTDATITLTNLAAGIYTVEVTDETTQCTASSSIPVAEPTQQLTMTSDKLSLTCLANGSIAVTASWGWGAYQYKLILPDNSVIGPQGNAIFSNLNQYGDYKLSVIDAKGCEISEIISFTKPAPLVPTLAATSNICFTSSVLSKIVVDVTGGVAPYTYSLNGQPAVSNPKFDNLIPDEYSIIVTDAYGCTAELKQTISEELNALATLTRDLNCATPDALIDVTIKGGNAGFNYQVSLDGGTTYDPTTNAVTGTTFSYTTITPGAYKFRIIDASGCPYETNVITITPKTLPKITSLTETKSILCYGEATASIKINIDNSVGTPPFNIKVNGIDYGSQTLITGLAAGTYTVLLTDNKFCTDTKTIIIAEPDKLEATYDITPIKCDNGNIPGSVTINNKGGKAPYNYYLYDENHNLVHQSLNDNSLTFSKTGLDYGNYSVVITDKNGCQQIIEQLNIPALKDLDIDISTLTSDCSAGGSVKVSVPDGEGAGPNFQFRIYPQGNWTPPSPDRFHVFTGLTPGVTYTFQVLDVGTGCTFTKKATGPVNTNSTLTSTVTPKNVTCTDAADGSVSFTFGNWAPGTSTIQYKVFKAGSDPSNPGPANAPVKTGSALVADMQPISVGGLAPGTYFILFTEDNGGCSIQSKEFTIIQSQKALELTVSSSNANCEPNTGVITATAEFGTAPYSFQFEDASGIILQAFSSKNTFNASAGKYRVRLKDKFGCERVELVTVDSDPVPAISATVSNQCSTTEGNFTIQVNLTSPGFGAVAYSLDGGAFQTNTASSFQYTGLNSGFHTIEVRDANGCGNLIQVEILKPSSLKPIIIAQPSCGKSDGAVTISAIGGSGNYTYEILRKSDRSSVTGGPQIGKEFTGLAAGQYIARIMDQNSLGCATEQELELEVPSLVSFSITKEDVFCKGGNNGSIKVNLDNTNLNPPYTYTLTKPDLTKIIQKENPVFTGLSAGTYILEVLSDRNCIKVETIEIEEIPELTLSVTDPGEFGCTPDNNVRTLTFTASAAGGTAPYLFSKDGINFTANHQFVFVDNGEIQSLSISVKDKNGCISDPQIITVQPLPKITALEITPRETISCNNPEEVELSVKGGSGDFTFELLPSAGVPSSILDARTAMFKLPTPGNYTFKVTDNKTGCFFISDQYTVAPFNTIEVTATTKKEVTCKDGNNGEIEINVTGYSGAYTYRVLDKDGIPTALTGSGDTSENLVIYGLTAGNYSVEITETDKPFCIKISNVIKVTEPPAVVFQSAAVTSAIACNGETGTVTITATGGTAPLSYTFNGQTNTTGIFTGVSAGNGQVYTIKDANGCGLITGTIDVNQPDPVKIISTDKKLYNGSELSCPTATDGEITVIAAGGTGTLTYSIDGGSFSTSNIFSNLNAGTYHIMVKDANNCSQSVDITITAPKAIEATGAVSSTYNGSHLTCSTSADGEITITAQYGTGTLRYSIDGGVEQTSNVFSGVAVGDHVIIVKDANGCFEPVNVKVIAPAEITSDPQVTSDYKGAQITCATATDGAITVTASGGTGLLSYSINGGIEQSANKFTGLGAGEHTIIVKDENGCSSVKKVTIIAPPSIIASGSVTSDYHGAHIQCPDDAKGEITITASGGTGTLKYAINGETGQTSNVFTGLGAGEYTITITDENDCKEELKIPIVAPEAITATTFITDYNGFHVSCSGASDGEITINGAGGTGALLYSINGGAFQADNVFDGLSAGKYTIVVKDENDCLLPVEITLDAPPALIATAVSTSDFNGYNVSCANSADGVVKVTASGGTGTLRYSIDNGAEQSSDIFTNLSAGNHIITIRDLNGCTQTVSVNLTAPAPIVVTETHTDDLCNGSSTGTATISASGGYGTFSYSRDGISYQSSGTFTDLATGDYTFYAKDENECVG
ncbi:MAG TPA: SprB repeat-containing protein, partial [Flavisolibacter sp.]|nr:SprB repeat-containing protein [Flavisolibacter sp.]